MIIDSLPALEQSGWIFLAFALTVAGLTRGFAGFGAGMIMMPLAATQVDPKIVAPTFLLLDSLVTLPMVPGAIGKCQRRSVAPAIIGAGLTVFLGVYLLAHLDQVVVRWCLSLIVLALLALIASGWRFKGEPTALPSLGVGMTAGVLGGLAQMSGPPVVSFWMSGPQPAMIIRANLITFFAFSSLFSYSAFWWYGLFSLKIFALALVAAPVYALALKVGSWAFSKASGVFYRRIAYLLILAAALTSLPIFDL
ncbi:sulfite exporter TauE/SafE family protein [Polycladidibacter hongkongensis]|uniref:sulfite exporter TauE/SafE family protein n=1 Tax=Polycladidibacter hongkongensis TaxID=1647556 RepID=UPI00083417C6|nr:sulfite exporter TauE/SafE family protein [Pseudovibrio hongkongensis]